MEGKKERYWLVQDTGLKGKRKGIDWCRIQDGRIKGKELVGTGYRMEG